MTAPCWHHYVTDNDGTQYCDRCGDSPSERSFDTTPYIVDRNDTDDVIS